MHAVGVKQICSLLAGEGQAPLTEMAISKFVADGMPKTARGRYDAIACLTWRVGQLRKREDRKQFEDEDGEKISMDQADIRLKTVRAQLEEMTLGEREGRLVPLEMFESELNEFTVAVRTSLLNLPGRIADRMEGLTVPERKLVVKEEVRRALDALARKGDEEELTEPADDTGVAASADASSEPARKRRKR